MTSSLSFRGMACKALDKVLPDNVKRLIFISSITGYLRDIQTPESALAERLNNLMNMGNRSNSLLVPIMLNSKIWCDFDPEKELKLKGLVYADLIKFKEGNTSMKDLRILSNVFIDNSPHFLRYGSKKEMRNDLIHLFKNIKGLQPA